MEKDFESSIWQWQPDGQFPDANSLKLPFDVGMQSGIPSALNCADAIPSNRSLPAFGIPGLPNFKPDQWDHPHGWFYCSPRVRQGVIPNLAPSEKVLPKTNFHGKVPVILNENCGEVNSPIATDNGRAPKRFLVFDQSGNKTTMIFSSGIGTPFPVFSALRPKPLGGCDPIGGETGMESSGNNHSGPNLTDELDEVHGTDQGSEMHEDTEEINALLYSDEEDNYSEDGEEASTGHSPSTMTAYEKQDWFREDDMDEVASSSGPIKRQKLSDGDDKVASVTKATSFSKPKRSMEYEDDAESCCGGGGELPARNGYMGSLLGNKRSRKEKIHETVSILQSIIPGGKGKDAVMVLDEAINYLRTLRFKAKSLGLSTFQDLVHPPVPY